jgi:hypothetical protein
MEERRLDRRDFYAWSLDRGSRMESVSSPRSAPNEGKRGEETSEETLPQVA